MTPRYAPSPQVLNRTCTMPTLDKRNYDALFGRFSNTSAMSVFSSLHDVLGRRLNARNVFDLALYTTLYQLGNLEGTTCVLP